MIDWIEATHRATQGNPTAPRRDERTAEQWRRVLDADVFRVTRQAGTERAFSSQMCTFFEPGEYHCACCDTHLFGAASKFDSGTGWPSFSAPVSDAVVAYRGPGEVPPPLCGRVHVVVRGDNPREIARKYYGSSAFYKTLIDANPRLAEGYMHPGDELAVPPLDR
jgi:hypothetical protein